MQSHRVVSTPFVIVGVFLTQRFPKMCQSRLAISNLRSYDVGVAIWLQLEVLYLGGAECCPDRLNRSIAQGFDALLQHGSILIYIVHIGGR